MRNNNITFANSAAFLFLVLLPTIFNSAHADGNENLDDSANKANAEKANDLAIMDKNFGAGIMANFDFTNGGGRVKSARVVGGIVRVEESSKAQVGFMLEAHKFISDPPAGTRRHVSGPFIGIVMQEQAIDTAVLGYMWGFRQPKTTQTLNLGIGLTVSPRAQILGDGIIADAPLPAGETEVRYKRTTKYGFAVITSFGF